MYFCAFAFALASTYRKYAGCSVPVSDDNTSACAERGADLEKIKHKKREAAETEKLTKDLDALKAKFETAIKENEELKKTQQETSEQFKECCVRYEREDVESKRKFEALVSIVHWLNKASQTADAETAVKVVDSSVTTQVNTTTAVPVITDQALPLDGTQVLPSQGVSCWNRRCTCLHTVIRHDCDPS
ncbi:MAG: hypothetical protein GY820_11630, partial [Gammaproteobacteria bacterium]|nr:hypothetical protein [Gammaproteobacteria bacterium]